MKLTNKKRVGLYHFVGTLLLLAVVVGFGIFYLDRFEADIVADRTSFYFLVVPLIFGLIFFLRGRQIFEYDSEGEGLHFKNRNVVMFLNKPVYDEFPKYKFLKYDFLNGILFKRLYITIISKKGKPVTLKYDVSYLTKKELNDLKSSLNKVIKTNKERENS